MKQYLDKYGARLAPKNFKSLNDIVSVVTALQKYLISQTVDGVKEVMDVLIDADLYKLDFVRLSDFFEKSDLVRKVNGFIQSQIQKDIKSQEKNYNNSKSVLYAIKEFMRILSFRPDDGKFILSRENDKVTL